MKFVNKICTEDNVQIVTIDKLPNEASVISNVLSIIAKQKIDIDMISCVHDCKGEIKLLFTTNKNMISGLVQALRQIRGVYKGIVSNVNGANAKIILRGCKKNHTQITSRIFESLYKNSVEIKLIVSGESGISVVVGEENADLAYEILTSELLDN